MRFSIFTPTNDTTYLTETYQSLKEQTYTDWEWILVPNANIKLPSWVLDDDKIKVYPFESDKVGELKFYACSKAKGEFLVELDHDDMLTPNCLEEIAKYDEDFIYSNCFQINDDWQNQTFAENLGWEYKEHTYKGHPLLEVVCPDATPSNFSRIWFAPNHVRVWKKSFYDTIGGHNVKMQISDDHELMVRSYMQGSLRHIDKPLYVYRIHGKNNWLKYSQDIQSTMWINHDNYFIPMQQKWCHENELRLVDLGGAISSPEGYESYDRHRADIVGDLNEKWLLNDSSVGLLRAHDIIEHLKDPIHTMNEAHRVLAHGGVFDIFVPSTLGVGAWCDPTHVSFWNKRSFKYYTDRNFRAYIEPECAARFQVVKLIDTLRWEGVPYVQAQLIAVKEGLRYHGELLI